MFNTILTTVTQSVMKSQTAKIQLCQKLQLIRHRISSKTAYLMLIVLLKGRHCNTAQTFARLDSYSTASSYRQFKCQQFSNLHINTVIK